MKNTLRVIMAFCLLSVTLFAAEEGRFFTFPTIHNNKIVFTYESEAIAVMLEKIKANPLKFAPKPAYPKK